MSTLQQILNEMPSSLHAVAPTAVVLSAIDTMCAFDEPLVLVGDDVVALGILSMQDILGRLVLSGGDPATTTVAEVMAPANLFIDADASPEEARQVMSAHHCRHALVVREGKTIGALSAGDIASWICDERATEIDTIMRFVTGLDPNSVAL